MNHEIFQSLLLAGKELTVAQQYGAVGAMSFPLFWLAGAGGAVFWVIGKLGNYP